MARLLDDDSSSNIRSGGARGFESDSAIINWQQFHNFLLQRMTANTAEDRLRYTKQYYSILQNGDAQSPPGIVTKQTNPYHEITIEPCKIHRSQRLMATDTTTAWLGLVYRH